MTDNDRSAGHRLIEIGAGVPFRVLGHEVLPALDESEFGIRLELKLGADGEEGDDADNPEDLVEWTAFGLMFVLGLLAFEAARPRELSALDYRERDELSVADFFEGLAFRRGELHFRADYIRSRRAHSRNDRRERQVRTDRWRLLSRQSTQHAVQFDWQDRLRKTADKTCGPGELKVIGYMPFCDRQQWHATDRAFQMGAQLVCELVSGHVR
jgi:hypothetical protein